MRNEIEIYFKKIKLNNSHLDQSIRKLKPQNLERNEKYYQEIHESN